jgi:pyrroloquinoline quinone (PQQ) biosynthesis protein C
MRRDFAKDLRQFGNAAREHLHEFEFNQLDRLIDYLTTQEQDPQAQQILQRDFKLFYQQYDQRRNKDFKYTFPQLAEWYEGL